MTYSQSFNGTVEATGFAAAQEVSSPLVSGASIAAGSVFTQGLTFTENTDGQSYAASGYTGNSPLVEIPAYYNGLPVTTIAANFAQSNTTIKAVVIPNGVEFIGASAFSGCINLTSVTLPASVTQIGNSAFLASGVTAVTCLATSVPTTGTTVFPTGTAIYVPQSALSAYTSAWSTYGTVAAQTFDGVAAQATNATNINTPSGNVTLAAALLNMVYPVGSVYMSVNNVSPQVFLGGTWVAFGAGRTLVGVDTSQTEFNAVEKTGGEVTHTLTVDEMPVHHHSFIPYQGASGGGTWGWSASQGQPPSAVYNQTKDTGGGLAHNNLQPYITCYMWKRTA